MPSEAALLADLQARARSWLPAWRPRGGERDVGLALLEIAARLSAEVNQRLKRVPEKSLRAFIHWIGLEGAGARAARLPVVLGMGATAEPLDAGERVQLQAQTRDGVAVMLETEQPLRVLPGRLQHLVAADPVENAFYLPPPDVLAMEAPKATAGRWVLQADAFAGNEWVQVEAAEGLAPGLMVRTPAKTLQRVVEVEARMVRLSPALAAPMPARQRLTLERAFRPAQAWINAQDHALYIGAGDLLKIEGAALIVVSADGGVAADAEWRYWGKLDRLGKDAPAGWQLLKPVPGEVPLKLMKEPGSIEVLVLEGHRSRWLRATREASALKHTKGATTSQLRLSVKGKPKDWPEAFTKLLKAGEAKVAEAEKAKRAAEPAADDRQRPAGAGRTSLQLDGLANTAPLVLDAPFYPLGREPRQFDAFYLGCGEAFSKARAKITLDFTVDDQLRTPLTAVPMGTDEKVKVDLLMGIGNDGRFIRLKATRSVDGEPGSRAVLTPQDRVVLADDHDLPIQLSPAYGLGAVASGGIAFASAVEVGADGLSVAWLYEQGVPDTEGIWTRLGFPPVAPAKPDDAGGGSCGILMLAPSQGVPMVYVLQGGTVHSRPAKGNAQWPEVAPAKPLGGIRVIVPVHTEKDASQDQRLIALDGSGALHLLSSPPAGAERWDTVAGGHRFDLAFTPLAFMRGGLLHVVGWESDKKTLLAIRMKAKAKLEGEVEVEVEVEAEEAKQEGAEVVGHTCAYALEHPLGGEADELAIYLVVEEKEQRYPVRWTPFSNPRGWMRGAAPAESKVMSAAPIVLGEDLIVPTDNASGVVTRAERWKSQTFTSVPLVDAARCEENVSSIDDPEKLLAELSIGKGRKFEPVAALLSTPDGRSMVRFKQRVSEESATALALMEEESADFQPLKHTVKSLTRSESDTIAIAVGKLLLIELDGEKQLVKVAKMAEGGTVVEFRPVLAKAATITRYWHARRVCGLESALRSALYLRATDPPAELDVVDLLELEGWTPPRHTSFSLSRAASPGTWILLPPESREGAPNAGSGINLTTYSNKPFREWTLQGGAFRRNPSLSWEFWDGQAWRRIEKVTDVTRHLINTGEVSFDVPDDLAPTDVMGRKNHWIRARLVGGNYGEESVTLTTAKTGDGQTVTRNTATIRAPYVIKLDVAYDLADKVLPDLVLTRDGGALVDQTAANNAHKAANAAHATLRYFVPLGETLQRFDADGAPATSGQPALYLGLDRPPSGSAVSLLFLVEDRLDAGGALPLSASVLRRRGFEPVPVDDGTRGLTESGTVVLQIGEPPESSQLFGQTAWWLRLQANPDAAGLWPPVVRGAWLNGTWASACETRENEWLGSSDGSPLQRVMPARPPVIAGSLELRVRERLGEEALQRLRALDRTLVEDEIAFNRGPWIRWTCVADTDDAGPDERVYSLDDASGEIRFGDGRHGRIPPPGADTILARRYRHGGGAAANALTAWTQVQLVTPLRGVDTVIAPDGAAGGTDPQDAAEVMRFAPDTLRLRGRAISPDDLAALARQFSPDIAQAAPVTEGGALRLVVVMRGRDPRPTQAALRELRRFLAAHSLPSLMAPDVLEIRGPVLRPLRVEIRLVVDRLAHGGGVDGQARLRVQALLDPATGGLDGRGWPVGHWPTRDEIAAVLAPLAAVEEIEDVTITAVAADADADADASRDDAPEAPPRLAADALAVVSADDVRCTMTSRESELAP
ncbi:hypothetical protein QTH90_21000 [Variovorax sp. J2P1-59]|uniref:hypothetical protein n=1 Tax=Variovorax flavidus TaxID=3053501 RepID=UPI0025779D54|nr:hypothetical protein [Variovorax sp. J2P1-59]MDM0076900.1 hypothetical protein [Variovorax sp. J2P1-59]